MKVHHVLFAIALGSPLAGCIGPRMNLQAVPPGEQFAGQMLNVAAPDSEGWSLLGSSDRGMAFAKQGDVPLATLGAQVLWFGLPPASSIESFEEHIRSKVEMDNDPRRFEVRSLSVHAVAGRPYQCARLVSEMLDRTPAGSPGPLPMWISSLYCRHPAKTDAGFAAAFSQRGGDRLQDFDAAAESFQAGVQVPIR